MPTDLSRLLPTRDDSHVTATIKLADVFGFLNLLHSLYAIHERRTHDENSIEFRRDDGFTLSIDFSFNVASFGKEGAADRKRYWTENANIGEMDRLLHLFLCKQDEQLRRFEWTCCPAPRKRMRRGSR